MAHTDIDRVGGITIRKLHSPDRTKVFGYLAGVKDASNNLIAPTEHDTLADARKYCGFTAALVATPTLPKSAYPQNQKGYDPHKR